MSICPVFTLSKRGLFSLVLLALASSACGLAQAQWKWRDAHGQVQYSDRAPPANVPEKDVLQRPPGQRGAVVLLPMGAPNPIAGAVPAASAVAAAASGSASSAAQRQRAGDDAKKRADEAAQRKIAEEAQVRQRAENCQQARDQIRLIQDGVRMGRLNAQGEREVLDDTQRARELARAQAAQASECR
jgi:hypothetical protein